MAHRLVVPLVLAVAVASGCGSGETGAESSSGPSSTEGIVASSDVSRVLDATARIDALCSDREVPASRLDEGVRALTAVFRVSPEARFEYGSGGEARSMRTVLEQERDRLRRCGASAQAARVDQALGEG